MSRNDLRVDTGAIGRCRTTVTGARQPVGAAGSDLAGVKSSGATAFGTLPDMGALASALSTVTAAIGEQMVAADWLLGQIEATLAGHQTEADNAETTNTGDAMRVADGGGQYGYA